MRVLVVEDHPTLADRIAQGLRQAGMAVDAVYDGAAALSVAAQTTYDVVVLDRDLPVIHGHPGLPESLSDPIGQRRVVLDHQQSHASSMRPSA